MLKYTLVDERFNLFIYWNKKFDKVCKDYYILNPSLISNKDFIWNVNEFFSHKLPRYSKNIKLTFPIEPHNSHKGALNMFKHDTHRPFIHSLRTYTHTGNWFISRTHKKGIIHIHNNHSSAFKLLLIANRRNERSRTISTYTDTHT